MKYFLNWNLLIIKMCNTDNKEYINSEYRLLSFSASKTEGKGPNQELF